MNQSIENINNIFLEDNIKYISDNYNFIKNEKDLFFNLYKESISSTWTVDAFENNILLVSKNNICNSKENLLLCLPFSKFNETIDFNNNSISSFNDNLKYIDNNLICKDLKIGIKNLVNSFIFLDFLNPSTKLGNSIERLSQFYNVNLLIFEEYLEIPKSILNKLNFDKIILSIDESDDNFLQVYQEKINPFEAIKELNLEDSTLKNQYSIQTKILFGSNNTFHSQKENLNPLKFNFEIIDILKNKFDLEILDINSLANLNESAYSSKIKIATNESRIEILLEEIKNYHTNIINNLNYKITIELKKENYNKISKKISSKNINEIKDLSLFLISSLNNTQKNNSINISKCNIDRSNNLFKLKGIIQSNNLDELNKIKNLISIENTKLKYNLLYTNEIPLNSINKKDKIRKKAITTYKNINHKKNSIQTINNSNHISKFANNNINSKGLSYFYTINKQNNEEIINILSLNKIYEWLNDFLFELSL